MDDNKQSGLMQIIKYGDTDKKSMAFECLKPTIIEEGDFFTASQIVSKYPDIFKDNDVKKQFINKTSDKFFKKLSIDDPVEGTKDLVNYMYDRNGSDKTYAIRQFPLFAMLALYRDINSDMGISGPNGARAIPEFKEVLQVYNVMKAIRLINKKSSAIPDYFAPELRSAVAVSFYLIDFKSFNLDKRDSKDVRVLENTSVIYEKAKRYFSETLDGCSAHLEGCLKEMKDNSADARFIKALLPLATLIHVKKEYEENLLSEYNRHTDLEKNSSVYAALEKFAPIFILEKYRKDTAKISEYDAERLFEIHSGANDIVKPFAELVKNEYLSMLCKKHLK